MEILKHTVSVLLTSLFCLSLFAQYNKSDSVALIKKTPEIFTSGFIDVMNNGQVNASARFIRLRIGEPGKLSIPLSIYGGVSNNTFNGSSSGGLMTVQSNEQLINQYINPLSGIINFSIDGIIYPGNKNQLTRSGIVYQLGERILTGYRMVGTSNPLNGTPVNFLNAFMNTGFYFQTGAWERNNAKNIGIFWMVARYLLCYSNSKRIKEFLPDIQTNGIYHGYSVGFGVEINNLINIKAIFYQYVKKPEIDYYLPIYQFTFNYSLKQG